MGEKYLFVFDIDGTAKTGKDKKIPLDMIIILQSLQAKGHLVTVDTGRGYQRARSVFGNFYPNVCGGYEDGARLVHLGDILGQHLIDSQTIAELRELLPPTPMEFAAFNPGVGDKYTVYTETSGPLPPVLAPITGKRLTNLDTFLTEAARTAVKITLKVPNDYEPNFGDISWSLNEGFVNINPRGVGKHTAVVQIAQAAGVALRDVIFAGNDYNDLTVFSMPEVGIKIAVGDNEAIKPHATHHVPTPDALRQHLSDTYL